MRSRSLAAAAVLAVAVAGTGSAATARPHGAGTAAGTSGVGGGAAARTAAAPRLTGAHPCPGQPGFTCSTLRVPLDHGGRVPGTLKLQVAAADNARAPKGTLLFLTGGPGQPGVPFISRLARERLPEAAEDYRFVLLDQRGTGERGAIDCPMLQRQVGSSDIEAPTAGAVAECARLLGGRRAYYGIDENTADIEALRKALGVPKLTLDGVSYGTYTAERYALAYPYRVDKLVLDSVLPHVDPQRDDALYLAGLRAAGRVLREACADAPRCGFDPARDLARVVARRRDGTRIFDRLVTYGFLDSTFRDPRAVTLPGGRRAGDIAGALHAAAGGADARLDELVAALDSGGDPVASYSSGLHIAAVCSDMRFPWGDSATPVRARAAALDRRIGRLRPAEVWPFDRQTAKGIGFVQECLRWPEAAPAPEASPHSQLPPVPTLLVTGDRDLSTPVEWAREEAARTPNGKLVVVEGAYHSVQNREPGTEGRRAVYEFLGAGG